MSFSPLIADLIDALRCLPGVGPKSAQRMALQLLERDRMGARRLATVLAQAEQDVGHCQTCRTLTEKELCDICASAKRDHGLVCVVETPMDVLAIEQSGAYRGVYHVLLGHLSPIDGIGPEDIGIDKLVQRVRDNAVSEVILATNSTVEGEATAFYVAEQLRDMGIPVSRIAHGVPLGGELEYVDGSTLMHALGGRKLVE